MSTNFFVPSEEHSDEHFYAVVNALKRQKALSEDSFVQNVAFFNLDTISKETQISELFRDNNEYNECIASLNYLLSSATDPEDTITSSLSTPQMMTFAQICLYKVLPCPEINCSNRAREVVTHNQYKDHEYECPFYHHDKDRRRLVLSGVTGEDFLYKANYYEEGKGHTDKDKYSQNYFESMFHPLYYKMFRCKRTHCNSHQKCPFYHYEEEKKAWDTTFNSFVHKDRVTYVKDKQKYFQSISPLDTRKQCYSENPSPLKSSSLSFNKNSLNGRRQISPKTAAVQFTSGFQRNDEIMSAQIKRTNKPMRVDTNEKTQLWDKNSANSANLKSSSFENFYAPKQNFKNRVC